MGFVCVESSNFWSEMNQSSLVALMMTLGAANQEHLTFVALTLGITTPPTNMTYIDFFFQIIEKILSFVDDTM